MFAPVEIVTLAMPDCAASSWLTATTCNAFGEGGVSGAVYVPLVSMAPQTPPPAPHPVPEICHTTCWLAVPSTVAVKLCVAIGASVTLEGITETSTWLMTVICALAVLVASAALTACTVTGLGVGIAPGAR